jgi:A118 family predicted phage portal protein
MALNNLWGKLGAFSRNVLVPSNVIYKSFDADPLVSDKMSRAISRWYGLYVDKPEWADDEVKPLGLPRAIAKEFAQVVSSEMTITVDGGPRADFINEQLARFQSNVQNSIELCMALGGMAFKPYVSGGNVFIDSTSAASFIPLRFDDGDNCVSGVFKSQPVKVDKSYFVKLEYHDFANGVYTIRNKAFTSDENGITGSEVELGRVPEWAVIPEEVQIKNVEKPLFGYFTPPVSNNIDTASSLGVSIYGGATEDLIRDADEQWARFLYEFESAERKIIGTPEAISGSLPGSKANPLLGDRLFIQMPYDSDDFFKEFSPALRNTGYYEGLQAILRRIEFNTGLAYGDLSDPATVEKTATEVMSAKIRKFNTVKALEDRFKAALENAVYGVDVYATLYGLAPRGEYALYIDFDDSILTDKDALRERDRQDVRDGLMQKWEYRVKWYNETEEVAKSMCPVESTSDPFNLG